MNVIPNFFMDMKFILLSIKYYILKIAVLWKVLNLFCLKTGFRNLKINFKPLQVFLISSLLCLSVAVFRPVPAFRKYENN